ncbi:hypothetical protein [Nocardia sp. SYP-A9097]|uniref:hypothetical protein n=1 Tax=Nocardia sp. SYP-A9097 TaxID=2663237 RepID=UPI001891581C|nr:hypothetical protein [Nocardia sp. SYP-A9097]
MNLEGIKVDWVYQQLNSYIDETKAVGQSTANVLTPRTAPSCGRASAIRLTETVRPILDRLYPEWKSENATSKNDEFKQERDAAQRLIARWTAAWRLRRCWAVWTTPRRSKPRSCIR